MRDVAGRQVEVAVDALDGGARIADLGEEGVVHAGRDEFVVRRDGRQVLDLSLGGDRALPEDGHAAADQLDLREEMRVQEDRPALRRFFLQQVADLPPADRIDAVRRLVEQEDVGLVHERGGQAEPLRHPLGELLDPHIGPVGEADALEQPRDPRTEVRRGDARHPPEDRERLAGRQVPGETMPLREIPDPAPALRVGDGDPEEGRIAGRGMRQAEEDLDRGRLARAVGAKKPEDLARLDPQVDAGQGFHAPATQPGAIHLPQAASLDG